MSKEVAKGFAESEFEKYRIVQDRQFESDFDKHVKHALQKHEKFVEEPNSELSPSEKFYTARD